jgi:hypothetical protein
MKSQNPWLDVTLIISLTAALIYVSGWAFATAYFAEFQLGLISLDIPHHYFFMYGFWVIKAYWYGLILLYALWLGLQYALNAMVQPYAAYLKLAAPIVILLLFWLLYSLGHQLAQDRFNAQQAADYPSYPAVQIWLTTDAKTPESLRTLARQLQQTCYRLLFHNKDNAFVFRPKRGLPGNLSVTAVPQHNIRSLRLLPRYQSCP